jgi:hypothetical protein
VLMYKRWIAANLRLLVVADLRQYPRMTPERHVLSTHR